MSRSRAVVLHALLLLMLLMVSSTASAQRAQSDQLVVGLALHGDVWLNVVEEIAQRFQEAYPGVDVEVRWFASAADDYYDRLPTLAAAGMLPDVFAYSFRERNSIIRSGMVLDITPYVEREPEVLQQILPPLRAAGQRSERYWGLPFEWAPLSIQFNRTFFDESGLPQPDALYLRGEWTFETLPDLARRLTRLDVDGNVERIGFIGAMDNETMFPWVWGMGERVFSEDGAEVYLDRPQVAAGLQVPYDMLHGTLAANTWNTAGGIGWDGFVAGKWAIALMWGNIIRTFVDEWGLPYQFDLLPFPAGPVSDRTTLVNPWLWGIASTSDKAAIAWEFIKFLNEAENDLYMMHQLNKPPNNVRNLLEMEDTYGTRNTRLLMEAVAEKGQVPHMPATYEAMVKLNEEIYGRAFGNGEPLVAVLEEAQRVVSAILRDLE